MSEIKNPKIKEGLKTILNNALAKEGIEWDVAILQIEVYEGGATYICNSYLDEVESFLLSKPDQDFTEMLKRTHRGMNKVEGLQWNKLIYTLKKDGTNSNETFIDSELQKRFDEYNKDIL